MKYWEEGYRGIIKKGILEIQNPKERGLGRNLGEESIWIRTHSMNKIDNSIELI
jgi:hypothetical protein